MEERVLYEELCPKEFLDRLEKCPVAYLPLGTLEWHGPHLPLGTDGLESKGFFLQAAKEIGGIVLPMIFLGIDEKREYGSEELYGMDVYREGIGVPYPYEDGKKTGSAYWIPDKTYRLLIESIIKQLKRAGFKIVVGLGHGPSTMMFTEMADQMKAKYDILLLSPGQDLPRRSPDRLIFDHAGESETSAMLYSWPELVHLERLENDTTVFPAGISGRHPHYASTEQAERRVRLLLDDLACRISNALSEQNMRGEDADV